MKKSSFLYFLLFLSTLSARALESKFDSSSLVTNSNPFFFNPKIALDTSLSHLEIYEPAQLSNYFGLGFTGGASHTMLLQSQLDPFLQTTFNNFLPYLFNSNLKFDITNKKPVTDVHYVIFPKQKAEQYIDVLHHRHVNSNLRYGVRFRKIRSNGYFLEQGSNNSNLLLNLSFRKPNKPYSISSTFFYNSIYSIENGGIISDSLNYSSSNIALQSLPVYLSDAHNTLKLFGGNIKQDFNFGRIDNDSLKHLYKISIDFNYSNQKQNYFDSKPKSGFYETILYDSVTTNNTFINQYFVSKIALSTSSFQRSGKLRRVISSAGLQNELLIFERKESINYFKNTSIFTRLLSNSKGIMRYSLDGNYYPMGYNKNNYSINFSLGTSFHDTINESFVFNALASIQRNAPGFVYQNYYSNHFFWNNQFVSISSKSVSLRLQSKKIVSSQIQITAFDNLIYLNSSCLPEQLANQTTYLTGSIDKSLRIKNWHLDIHLIYQKLIKGEKDVFGLPEIFMRNSIYWNGNLFKKALFLQSGFDMTYASKYYGLAYQPSLNAFHYQNSTLTGGYPAIDFFINFKIKQARLFFKVDHLNYGLMKGEYSFTPSYILPGRTYRLGINWIFYN